MIGVYNFQIKMKFTLGFCLMLAIVGHIQAEIDKDVSKGM